MKDLLNQKVQLAFGLAMLTLLLMGFLSYRWMVASDESDNWVRHSHEVRSNIQDLALAMEGVESASRGFVLTGDESDLDAYRANVSRVEQDQAAIRTLTADNPAQQVDFSHLESLVYERIQHTDMLINLRRTQGFAAAMAAIDSGPGEQDAEFQALVGKLQNEEARVRAQLIADTLRHSNQTKVILICGTLLGILVAGVAAWTAVRDSSKRASAAEAFQQSEERYRMLLDEVRDFATFMLDPQGTVISWSASAEHITGYTAEQIIGHNFSRFFVAGDIKRGRPEEVLRARYLALLKKSLCNLLYPEHELRISHLRKRASSLEPQAASKVEELRFLRDIRFEKQEAYRVLLDSKQDVIYGMSAGIPVPLAHTMVGLSALKNLEVCAAELFRRGIPGDFLEAGVCQGGASIFMRALQVTHGEGARKTWLLDSFQGLPVPREPVDLESGIDFSEGSMPQIACSLDAVRDHFLRYDLLDDQVEFVPGWFEDTLPGLSVGQLAMLRVDADLYSSTRDVLDHLYDRVAPGGFIIVDDYGAFPFCRRAVDDFRARRGLRAPLRPVDQTVVFWEKTDP